MLLWVYTLLQDMKIHTLQTKQFLPISLNEAWDFFSTPLNLNEITPPDMSFEILSDIEGKKMYSGMLINYFVSPFPLVRLRWTTEITHVEDKKYFVDEQRFGPYAFWHHKHFFEEVEGGVMMTDIVDYGLPFWIFGDIAHVVFVKNKLKSIFDYRYKILEKRFSQTPLFV